MLSGVAAGFTRAKRRNGCSNNLVGSKNKYSSEAFGPWLALMETFTTCSADGRSHLFLGNPIQGVVLTIGGVTDLVSFDEIERAPSLN